MTPAILGTLLSLLDRYGPAAYNAAVNLFHKPDPSKADFLAVSDAAMAGSAMQDELAAKDRADRKAGTGAYAGQGPQP